MLVTQVTNEQRLAVAKQSGTKYVMFSAVGDDCPLCKSLDGKVFRSDSLAAKRISPPIHINCDCIWVALGDDQDGKLDLFTSRDLRHLRPLIEQHGHFVRLPGKYQELRIPARPDGRDFTFRRAKPGQRGKLEWHRSRYPIKDLAADVEQTGVAAAGAPWRTVDLKRLEQATTVDELAAWAKLRWPRMDCDLELGDPALVRETLGQLDQLGRLYRDVEDAIPAVRVAPFEEFLELLVPGDYANTDPDGAIHLNGGYFGKAQDLAAAWQRETASGGRLALPAARQLLSHEFGHVLAAWLERNRAPVWNDVKTFLEEHQAEGIGLYAMTDPAEAFSEAFAAMHLLPRSQWPPYLNALRPKLRYELRRRF